MALFIASTVCALSLIVTHTFAYAKTDLPDSTTEALVTPTIIRWRQYNYTGEEDVDLTSLEDAFHPIILTSEVHGDEVTLTMTYVARLTSTPFWEFKFDGVSYTVTQGFVFRNGQHTSTSVHLPVQWKNNQFLAVSISSDIGIYYIELDFDFLRKHWVDMSVPRIGIQMSVPETFEGTEFNVTFRKSEQFNESCFGLFGKKALLNCVDGIHGGIHRTSNVFVTARQTSDTYSIYEFIIRDDYEDVNSEVVLFPVCVLQFGHTFKTYGIFKDKRLVKYARRNVDETIVNITFVDSIYGKQEELNFDEEFPYRSISCEAFGTPKPRVTILDEAGNLLPTVELKQRSSMGSRIVATLDEKPLAQVVGLYTCRATAGNQTIERTIRVKKVVRPEIIVAELLINNTDEIIAVCAASGHPQPNVSFSINYAKDDIIEKRPLLETERTMKLYNTYRYKKTGGLEVDEWFRYRADRCPPPESLHNLPNHQFTQKMVFIKPLPYLSRQSIQHLYCRAEGYDNVYVTKKVTSLIPTILHTFMRHVAYAPYINMFG